MAKRRKKKSNNTFFRVLLVVLFLCYGFYLNQLDGTYSSDKTIDTFNEVSTDLRVSYLDVGQADSILIENNGEVMLIDAGNNDDGELLVKYFKQKEIKEFKYLVGTHPHEDHIGGLDDVINNFDIETIYMPDVITTTKTFVDVLDAIEAKNLSLSVPKIQEVFKVGEATIEVLYTGVDVKDLNNASIVLRLVFGKISFLFTGDATEKSEEEILRSGLNLKADVLKVGHHGSKYSTSNDFLNMVNPRYAVISVGTGNSYKHPESETINKLNDKNIEIHRTDLEGSIIVVSDGENIEISNIKTDTNG